MGFWRVFLLALLSLLICLVCRCYWVAFERKHECSLPPFASLKKVTLLHYDLEIKWNKLRGQLILYSVGTTRRLDLRCNSPFLAKAKIKWHYKGANIYERLALLSLQFFLLAPGVFPLKTCTNKANFKVIKRWPTG